MSEPIPLRGVHLYKRSRPHGARCTLRRAKTDTMRTRVKIHSQRDAGRSAANNLRSFYEYPPAAGIVNARDP